MPPEVERKLAAILTADVVGYSHLMAEDEAGTIRTVTSYRNGISDPVGDHRGRAVELADGLHAPPNNALHLTLHRGGGYAFGVVTGAQHNKI